MGMPRALEMSAPPYHAIAERGQYFTFSNATPGTGVATIAAQASLASTSPFIMVIAGARSVYFDFLRLMCTAPGTAGTQLRFATKTDAAKAAPTGGVAGRLANSSQLAGALATPSATLYAGPLVAAAATGAEQTHGSKQLRPAIPVIGDEYFVRFGSPELSSESTLVVTGTAIVSVVYGTGPIIIGPGQVAQFHIWLPSQSAASSWEYELGCWEF